MGRSHTPPAWSMLISLLDGGCALRESSFNNNCIFLNATDFLFWGKTAPRDSRLSSMTSSLSGSSCGSGAHETITDRSVTRILRRPTSKQLSCLTHIDPDAKRSRPPLRAKSSIFTPFLCIRWLDGCASLTWSTIACRQWLLLHRDKGLRLNKVRLDRLDRLIFGLFHVSIYFLPC